MEGGLVVVLVGTVSFVIAMQLCPQVVVSVLTDSADVLSHEISFEAASCVYANILCWLNCPEFRVLAACGVAHVCAH